MTSFPLAYRRIGGIVLALIPALALADGIDDFVLAQMRWSKIPGLSLAVCKNGEIVKAMGYGYSDLENQILATPKTVYRIASVSKQFVAAGVMTLVQSGKLSLDDSVSKVLVKAPKSWKGITIRSLMNHTSGLPREIPATDLSKDTPVSQVVTEAFLVPLRFAPGEKWAYSNIGYFVLAEIISTVSGEPWLDYIQKSVFAPSGIRSTFKTTEPIIPNLAKGYDFQGGKWLLAEKVVALRPSGAFASTVEDLAKWDRALRSESILSASSKAAMWTPTTLANGQKPAYGFGWFLDPWNGNARVYHGGGIPGFAADFQRFTTEGITVVVLSNIGGRDLSSITTGVTGFYSKKLVEPLEPVIRDENPDFTSKVKALINDLSKGKFDPALFTSTVADRIRKDIDRGIPKSLQEQGPLQSIELLESRVEPKSHLYKYRLRYKHLTLFATLVVNGDGQVEKWGLAD